MTAKHAWPRPFEGRFPQRRLFLIRETLFVLGCVASAAGHVTYAFGRILAGFSTGLLLVIALPPVIRKFPPEKLLITVVFINIGFFGAVCVGPLLGGAVAAGHAWRWFFAVLGGIGALRRSTGPASARRPGSRCG